MLLNLILNIQNSLAQMFEVVDEIKKLLPILENIPKDIKMEILK